MRATVRLGAMCASLGFVLACRAHGPAPPPIAVPSRACAALEAPPVEQPIRVIVGGEPGCPAGMAACLDAAAAMALDANVRAWRRWAKDAWTLCGPAQ